MQIRASGRIVEIEYGSDEPITVVLQYEVKAALTKAILQHPVGMLVHVPESLRQLDVRVVAFWMVAMRELAPGLRGMAAVSNSRGFGFLADNFSKTLSLLGTQVPVRVFKTVAEATEWLETITAA